jgi:predicted dienelactone hydrolase
VVKRIPVAIGPIVAAALLTGCGFVRIVSRVSSGGGDDGAPPPAVQAVRFLPSEEIAGRVVAEWIPGSEGKHPLIVFSHGYGGSKTQSKTLMNAFAEDGYIVVAPDHRDAGALSRGGMSGLGEFRDADQWTDAKYRDRGEDIRAILDAMRKSADWSRIVDWDRVGLAGHSLGGYTALALAGAWPSWRLPNVKAVLALSPYAQPFILKGTLKGLAVPVMYQGGTLDLGITPTIRKNSGAFDGTPSPAYYVEFRRAGHFAWTDLNPKFQASIAAYSVAFFDKYLRGSPEPDLQTKRDDVAELRSK